jgi:hypothetical protein
LANRVFLVSFLFCLQFQTAQAATRDSIYYSTQQSAEHFIDGVRSLPKSDAWPGIDPVLFLDNLKLNVHEPLSFYPGRSTNFCGYGALSYLMIKQDPLGYARFMLDLYRNGRAAYRSTTFTPSAPVKRAAGTLKFKGVLDIRHAEQMWFLVLADHYKGYLNIFNRAYDTGDENAFWAATNFAKFNRMVKRMIGYKVHAVGSDLIRPWKPDLYEYILGEMPKGIVVIYLNNRVIHKKNHTQVKLSFPTHFVILEKLVRDGDLITFQYWDYGSRTVKQVTPNTFKRLIYGVSTCTKPGTND